MDTAPKNRDPLAFRKGDLLAVGMILLLAAVVGVVFWLQTVGESRITVEIRLDGELVESFSLDEERTVTVAGQYTNLVVARDGAVWVEESDCPGEDCVHSGKVSQPGRAIVCLPNRMEIRLVGDRQPDQVDMVAG